MDRLGIYVNCDIKFQEVINDIPNSTVIHLIPNDIHIVCTYRPSSYSINDDFALLSYIGELCHDKEVFVLGDFNLPSLRWDLENLLNTHIPPQNM